MKTRRTYSGNFKARVLRDLLNGKGNLMEIADQYEVHPNLIKNWKSILIKRAHLILEDKRRKPV